MASHRLKKHKSPKLEVSKRSKKKLIGREPVTSKKMRKMEEDIRDSHEDDCGELASTSEGDIGGGLVSKSSMDSAEADDLVRECETSDIMEQDNEDGAGNEDGTHSEDGIDDSESDNQTNADEIASTSSFHHHVGHVITNKEADTLVKSKWQYKWEMPAVGMLMSKCMGTGECLSEEVLKDQTCGIHPKLYKHWLDIYEASENGDFDARLRFFFSLCNTYRDIMHCDKKPFYLKGAQEDSCIMDAYLMHALNHVFKTRDVVVKNDSKLTKHQEGEKEVLSASSSLDHGFTRPKVMLLLPFASIMFRVVKKLIHLTPLSRRANVEHIDRFTKDFGADDVEKDDDETDGSSKYKKPPKSKDFELLFGGNNSDHFMIGVKFTKRSIKLYSDFYSSDIIIASPLGLITKIGEAEVEKEKDVDYLSSIEVLIIDHADVIAMQNWSHVNTVVEQLNRTPAKQHGTDVMRIRQWYLDGHARFYRQTLLLGAFANPDMNALFNGLCLNYEGKVKLKSEYKGVLPKVLAEVRQVYERFDAPSIVDVDDSRLEYFTKKVYPKIKDSSEGGTMLFISSYFEFVRLRNFLKSQDASFCLLGEYTKPSDISRARVWFFEGQRKIMLYTERAHFYHRYKIRGVKNLIIYSLPERKEFYPEIINMLEGSKNMTCNVIFSRFDQLKLERIVGTTSSRRMLSSDKDIFVFC